jgi:hypothetical protein
MIKSILNFVEFVSAAALVLVLGIPIMILMGYLTTTILFLPFTILSIIISMFR